MKKLSDKKKLPITTKPTKVTGASLKPLPAGCIEDKALAANFHRRPAGKASTEKAHPNKAHKGDWSPSIKARAEGLRRGGRRLAHLCGRIAGKASHEQGIGKSNSLSRRICLARRNRNLSALLAGFLQTTQEPRIPLP